MGTCEVCGKKNVRLRKSRQMAEDPDDRLGVRYNVCKKCNEQIEHTAGKYGYR